MVRILIIVLIVLSCQNDSIILTETRDYIAFHRNPESGSIYDFDIWLVNLNTGEEIQVTRDLQHWEHYPVWLSDTELLYLYNLQPPATIQVAYVNFRTGQRKILEHWTYRNHPEWGKMSIDNMSYLWYADLREENVYKTLFNIREINPEIILSLNDISYPKLTQIMEPAISMDGSLLALIACDSLKWHRLKAQKKVVFGDLYIYNLRKDTLIQLTSGDYNCCEPAWLDNATIILPINKDGNYELYKINVHDKEQERLTYSESIEETEPAVSPDRTKIVYSRLDLNTGMSEIWIMDLETKETRFLTKGSAPDWSPAQ